LSTQAKIKKSARLNFAQRKNKAFSPVFVTFLNDNSVSSQNRRRSRHIPQKKDDLRLYSTIPRGNSRKISPIPSNQPTGDRQNLGKTWGKRGKSSPNLVSPWGKSGEVREKLGQKIRITKFSEYVTIYGEILHSHRSKVMAATIKKGALVRVLREALENSLEAQASDRRLPSYLFNSKGEVLDLKEDYALVRFYVPTPSVWLRVDQLELAS